MRSLLVLPLLLAACTPDPTPSADPPANAPAVGDASALDAAADPSGDERFVITTRNGDVDLGLTDAVLFFRLSPKTVEAVRDDLDAEVEDAGEGLGGTIARAVTEAVGSALQQPVTIPLADIEDVRYADGQIHLVLAGDRDAPSLTVDDESVYRQFAADDARRFVQAFRDLKAAR